MFISLRKLNTPILLALALTVLPARAQESLPTLQPVPAVAEGLVQRPLAMTFDAAGWLYVAEAPAEGSTGTILRLGDTDGDGVYETRGEFATGLALPTALAAWDGGLFVGDAPNIIYLKDADGDGAADIREGAYTGFGAGGAGEVLRGFTWGADNRIHGVAFPAGGAVRRSDAPSDPSVSLDGAHFAFNPRTREIGTEPGAAESVALDAFGRTILSLAGGIAACRDDAAHGRDAVGVAGGEGEPGGTLLVLEGGAWPAPWRGALLSGSRTENTIRAYALTREGRETAAQVLGTVYQGEAGYLPRQLVLGPGDALYVIESRCCAGEDMGGRVLRLGLPGSTYKLGTPPAALPGESWPAVLGDDGAWASAMVAAQIQATKNMKLVPALSKAARGAESPVARVRALYAMSGLGGLSAAVLEGALADVSPEVRALTLRLAKPYLLAGESGSLTRAAVVLLADADPIVRYEAALSLPALPLWERRPAAKGVLANNAAEAELRDAVLAGMKADVPGLFVEMLIASAGAAPGEALSQVARSAGALLEGDALKNSLRAFEALGAEVAGPLVAALANGAAEGRNAVALRALAQSEGMVASALSSAIAQAREAAVDTSRTPEERAAAMELAAFDANPEGLVELFGGALQPATPIDVQVAALRAMGHLDDRAGVVSQVLAALPVLGPQTRKVAMDLLLSRAEWARGVLDALTAGTVTAKALDAAQVGQLMAHADLGIRESAGEVLGNFGVGANAAKVGEFARVFQLAPAREHGKQIFVENCSKCHVFEGEGFQLAPELSFVSKQGKHALLKSILDPNADVLAQFYSYTVETNDFETFTGILTEETNADIRLRGPSGEDHRVARDNISTLVCSEKTMMPEDWETALGEQNLADLIAYLADTAAQPKKVAAVAPATTH